jgi:hypothetical protein
MPGCRHGGRPQYSSRAAPNAFAAQQLAVDFFLDASINGTSSSQHVKVV